MLHYQMTRNSAVNRNLACVINNWNNSSYYLGTKKFIYHFCVTIELLIWLIIKITDNCFNFIIRRQELSHFSFKMFKIIRFLRSPKCSKTMVELTFTTQKANTCSLLDWLFCSLVSFLGKFGPKTQNCQFKLKFGT